MSTAFKVVTDITEIAKLNKRLGQQLRKTFAFKRTREITYPSGHHSETVFFQQRVGKNVRAWCHYTYNNKLINLLLAGDPSSQDRMQIEVQLNFPAENYNRRVAGAFVVDENGDYFVAHRGKLTKGKAGLHKAKVLREFASQTVEVLDKSHTITVILVSAIDDHNLADRMWNFAQEARQVATQIASENLDETSIGSSSDVANTDSGRNPVLTLRAYFDEYSGSGRFKGNSGGKRVVEHGDIVKMLEAKLKDRGASLKSRAIDLAIESKKFIDLYEVKTSARTTDLYTGVGQLLIHGECIHETLHKNVRRHLVLPENPHSIYAKHIKGKAGINVITFKKTGSTYQFHGLD